MAFSFGSNQQNPAPQQSGFSFNNPAASAPAPAGGAFSFSTPAASTSQPGLSFGTSSAPSLFGNTSTATSQPATSTAFGGFGASGSLFNNKGTTTTGFGGTTGTGFGGFGSTTSSFGLGAANNTANRDRQIWQLLVQVDEEARRQQAALLTEEQYKPQNIWQALALLKSWWDPKSPYCRFKHYFYNLVPQQEVHLYQKPLNHDKKAWDEAQKKNPDPTCYVPALAVGFDDVTKRMETQEKQALAHIATLKEAEAKINKLRNNDTLATAKKLDEYKTRHMELTQRVIWLLKKAQVLRNKGLPITPEEEDMRAMLESIQEQLLRSEQFHGKLSQLWAQLQLIKESGRKYGKLDDVHGWNGVKGDNMKSITQILEEQQNGIQHTMDILEQDHRTVDTMTNHHRLHN